MLMNISLVVFWDPNIIKLINCSYVWASFVVVPPPPPPGDGGWHQSARCICPAVGPLLLHDDDLLCMSFIDDELRVRFTPCLYSGDENLYSTFFFREQSQWFFTEFSFLIKMYMSFYKRTLLKIN